MYVMFGNNSMRVCSDEAPASKIFIWFIALILRCRLYADLKKCCEKMAKRTNYMTVPASQNIAGDERIFLIDREYGVSHADDAAGPDGHTAPVQQRERFDGAMLRVG